MTLFDLAYKNVVRDFKTYLYHFINCLFSVFVFFIFSAFAYHPALKVVEDGSTIGLILLTAEIISLLFAFVFTLYSIGNFLKVRSKQFAIINLVGASKKQFKAIIFYENMIISGLSLICGIGFGLIFSKFFFMISEKMIPNIQLDFYLPLKAMLMTFLVVGGLFLFISYVSPYILRRTRIIKLLKTETVSEKSYLGVLSLVSIVILGLIFYLYQTDSILFLPLLGASSLTLFYTFFGLLFKAYTYALHLLQKRRRKLQLLTVSNFNHKIQSNLKTMSLVFSLLAIILTSFIVIIGSPLKVEEVTRKILPVAYTYTEWQDTGHSEKNVQYIRHVLSPKKGYKELRVNYLYNDDPTSDLPFVTGIISNSTYNQVSTLIDNPKLNLKSDEYFLAGFDGKKLPVMGVMQGEAFRKLGISNERGRTKKTIALSGYFQEVIVISDQKYQAIQDKFSHSHYTIFDILDWKKAGKETKMLQKYLKKDTKKLKVSLSSAYEYYNNEWFTRSLISYVGSILCFSFLVGMTSLIYSRLYNSSEEEVERLKALRKIGLSVTDIKKILSSTVKWILIVPFISAMFVTWGIFMIINNYSMASYWNIVLACSGLYLIIETVSYGLIVSHYQKFILKAICNE
ncbi:FtsX-like permease family protein [Streptococcus catagoni]|uniref:FtsX-like permease family protein n=1 Tax=Streptococcus catagoni TaxID=2654874 RepID=UPI00140DB4C4|nr:ABC transporter permease [Streptococcus catagoni]